MRLSRKIILFMGIVTMYILQSCGDDPLHMETYEFKNNKWEQNKSDSEQINTTPLLRINVSI